MRQSSSGALMTGVCGMFGGALYGWSLGQRLYTSSPSSGWMDLRNFDKALSGVEWGFCLGLAGLTCGVLVGLGLAKALGRLVLPGAVLFGLIVYAVGWATTGSMRSTAYEHEEANKARWAQWSAEFSRIQSGSSVWRYPGSNVSSASFPSIVLKTEAPFKEVLAYYRKSGAIGADPIGANPLANLELLSSTVRCEISAQNGSTTIWIQPV